MSDTDTLLGELTPLGAREILAWASRTYGPNVAFSSSLGAEDQVLAYLIGVEGLPIRCFTLDTGRLFPESYNLIEETERRLGIRLEIHSPEALEVENMVNEHGINLFRKSVGQRKLCCSIRKVSVLKRALRDSRAWICGLRRDQSTDRADVRVVQWDADHELLKINPLWNWSDSDVWSFIRDKAIPYNPLHDQGFASIGCAPCTRAIAPGEHPRAGRWWWESAEHKECGLHRRAGT